MQGLMSAPLGHTTAVLDVLDPVDLTAPLNRDLHNWHLVLRHAMGGVTWRNLVRPLHPLAEQKPGHVLLSGTEPRSAVVGWGATTRQGGWGELRLDGVAAGAIPSSSLYDFVNAEFTVSCWVRATVAAQAFVLARRTSAGLGGWFLRLDSGGTATARLMNTGAGTIVQRTSVTATLLTGAWVHLAAAFTTNNTLNASNEIALYVNGRLDQGARTGNAGLYNTPEQVDVTLGMYVGITPLLTGALDDVRITRRGLSATEVQQLYRASRTGYRRELRWLSQPFFVGMGGTVRALMALLDGSSSTPAVSVSLLRHLTTSLSASSATASVTAQVSRQLTASLSAHSATSGVSVAVQRRLGASLAATSVTPTIAVTQQRALTAILVASSTTLPITLLLPGQILLTATLVGQSITPALAPPQMGRRLVVTLQGSSSTAPSGVAVRHALTATLAATSATPSVTVVLTQQVILTAQLQGVSSTSSSAITLHHALQVGLAGVSLTTPPTMSVQRALRSLLVGVSMTPPALLLPTTGLVLLSAALVGISHTSAIVVLMPPTVRVGVVPPGPRTGTVATSLTRVGSVLAEP